MADNSSSSALVQEIEALYPISANTRYSVLSATVIILYDYFLTLPLEISQIWRGKINLTKVLFILLRYSSIIYLYGFVSLFFFEPATDTRCAYILRPTQSSLLGRCRRVHYIAEISNLFAAFAINSIFILRTFAISGRSWLALVFLSIPGYAIVALNIWLTIAVTAAALPQQLQVDTFTCDFISHISQSSSTSSKNLSNIFTPSHVRSASLISFVSSAVFDLLVMLLTMYRTGRLALQSRKAGIKGSLGFILFRDGILYYCAIFIPEIVIVALDAVDLKTNNGALGDALDTLGTIFDALQVVLVNRLVLNLSQSADAREDSEFRTRTGMEPPVFVVTNSLLGNIGQSLRTVPYDDLEGENIYGDKIIDDDAGVHMTGC